MASSHLSTNSPASTARCARSPFACDSLGSRMHLFYNVRKELKCRKQFRPKRKVRLTGTWLDRLRFAAADFFLLLVLFALFPALLLEVLLVEFFLFLRLVVGCLVGSAAIQWEEGKQMTDSVKHVLKQSISRSAEIFLSSFQFLCLLGVVLLVVIWDLTYEP